MVLRESLDVMVERVDTGRRDDPRLPHRSSEQVLLAPRALHQFTRAGEQRAERATEAFRQTERHGVEARGDRGRARTPSATEALSRRAPSRCTASSTSRAVRDDLVELVERPDPSAGAVVRVLEREQHGTLVRDLRARLGSVAHLLGRDAAASSRQREGHEPRVGRRAPVLVDHDVRVLLRDEDVSGPRVELQRDLVRHRRRREEDRRLLAEQRRDALLQRR